MPLRNPLAQVALLLSCALATVAQAADTPHGVHYRLLNKSATLPKKVVVIPASLAALLSKSGVDAVVMVYGRDYASTAGRKTKAVLGKIPIINNMMRGPMLEQASIGRRTSSFQRD